jgi:hypothetical protein
VPFSVCLAPSKSLGNFLLGERSAWPGESGESPRGCGNIAFHFPGPQCSDPCNESIGLDGSEGTSAYSLVFHVYFHQRHPTKESK